MRGAYIEMFSCSGGMAEGFRRAGIEFDFVFDKDPDAVASYESNLGHRPVQMDVRDLLRMVKGGWSCPVDLLVADPPCTPWSRAGKRKGTTDPRDMLRETTTLIALLRPRAYLIGNVPGLEDSTQWSNVQRALDPLLRLGYCVADFVTLDAADFGVPQHRVRPFWYGHLGGPCIAWEPSTHCAPEDAGQMRLDGPPLKPWVTCREALGHLKPKELGRPVRLRRRSQNSTQHGSVADRPARVVGTSNLSDGNVLLVLETDGQVVLTLNDRHPPSEPDAPSMTICARDRGGAQGGRVLMVREHHAIASGRTLARTITSKQDDGRLLEWPWARPATTVQSDPRLAPPGRHDANWNTPDNGRARSTEKAIVLSERAAALVQGFPDGWTFVGKTKRSRWSQIGQAMPPPLAHAVASSVVRQLAKWEAPLALIKEGLVVP